jgi:hypothetical protein
MLLKKAQQQQPQTHGSPRPKINQEFLNKSQQTKETQFKKNARANTNRQDYTHGHARGKKRNEPKRESERARSDK